MRYPRTRISIIALLACFASGACGGAWTEGNTAAEVETKSEQCHAEGLPSPPSVPKAIRKSETSTLKIFVGGTGNDHVCSATRVADNIILSAAHCFLGMTGQRKLEEVPQSYIINAGTRHSLEVIEVGDYRLVLGGFPDVLTKESRMQDWMLLESVDGAASLGGIGIADFPDADEMKTVLGDMRNFGECEAGAAVWSITYPKPMARTHPRPSHSKMGSVFLSRGHLMTDEAYKKSVLYLINERRVFDDQYGMSIPDHSIDLEVEWNRLRDTKNNQVQAGLYCAYDLYEKASDPLLYHSAELNHFSSGGGVFIESTGHFLGLIPFNVGEDVRSYMYGGDYHLYRIDVVCKQSQTLSKLEKCARLAGSK